MGALQTVAYSRIAYPGAVAAEKVCDQLDFGRRVHAFVSSMAL